MAERLECIRLEPLAILDAGCGTGAAQATLGTRFPRAQRVALDLAWPMLAELRARQPEPKSSSLLGRIASRLRGAESGANDVGCVCGDIGQLPFAPASFDLVWSNFALQWIDDLPSAFAEFGRVLRVGGLLSFTTFGPDTLQELRAAFTGVDRHTHVSRFVDMHDIGDLLVRAGFADPVLDVEMMTLTYGDGMALMRDLRAIGATNATQGRPRGLTGRRRWQRTLAALEAMQRDGRIPTTFEVIYAHAWRPAPRVVADGRSIVQVLPRTQHPVASEAIAGGLVAPRPVAPGSISGGERP